MKSSTAKAATLDRVLMGPERERCAEAIGWRMTECVDFQRITGRREKNIGFFDEDKPPTTMDPPPSATEGGDSSRAAGEQKVWAVVEANHLRGDERMGRQPRSRNANPCAAPRCCAAPGTREQAPSCRRFGRLFCRPGCVMVRMSVVAAR